MASEIGLGALSSKGGFIAIIKKSCVLSDS
jgi:hypothetical protein